ncbi:MAG: hypothetical protein KGI51_08755 [Rhodospirillales bacterium]|nr:hypothetical protein [Rhodospirillales bacterium]
MTGHPQLLLCTYHKSGTTLFDRLARRLAAAFGLTLSIRYGYVAEIPPEPDIVLLAHSLIGRLPARPFRGIRVIRDPRDLWVSAWLYHRRTEESWCTNTNLDPTPPITYPRIDFATQHMPEDWKRAYLARLNGRSYQQNLRERDKDSGLDFELANYTANTLAAMRAWRFSGPDLRDVRLESFAANYDGTMRAVLAHLGFVGPALDHAVALAAAEDIARMDDAAIAARPQIGSRTLSKWRDMLSPEQIAAFEARHGDLIDRLGYPRVS